MAADESHASGGNARTGGEIRQSSPSSGVSPEQLHAEMLQLLKRLNTPANAPSSPSTLRVLFSGAGFWTAVVTAILSLVTAVLVQTYQARQAKYQLVERRAGERLQAQFRMMSNFGQRFPLGLNLAYRMVDLSVWLTANAARTETAKYEGLSWSEQYKAWDALKDRYLERDNVLAMCAEISATFDDSKTIAQATKLRNTVRELLDVPDKNEPTLANIEELHKRILDLHLEADSQYVALLEQMGAELRGKNGSGQ